MKTCTHTNDNYIEKYVLNVLTEEEEIEFQKHLLECDECFSKLQSVRRLAASLSDEEIVEKKSPILRYFSIAASIILLIGISAYFVLRPPSVNHIEIALSTEDSTRENRMDTITHETEEPVLQKDFLAEITNEPVSDTKTNAQGKENPKTEKKQDETSAQSWNIHEEPYTASIDFIGFFEPPSTDALSQKVPFKVMKPGTETTVSIDSYTLNTFEFSWKINEPTLSILAIRSGTAMLGEFRIENDNNIRIDLSNYTKYEEIEWILMVGSVNNRTQGKIFFRK